LSATGHTVGYTYPGEFKGSEMNDLSERTALITGASRGIGAAIAKRYSAAGMRVALNYRADADAARETLETLNGDEHILIQADVSDPSDVSRMVEIAASELGKIDVLVNNAGIFEDQFFLMEDYAEWQRLWKRTLDTNLMSAVNATYCVLPHMRPQGGGKVINVASRAAFKAEIKAPAYAVSKAGMVSLTRCLARSLAADNILSYCIAPGFTETDMARESMDTRLPEIVSQIPLGRVASVEDVAGVALFLASDDANYLTGVTIDVNGGSYLH
jgi:NAD(P)-dependent dehydrogenase (short-subunit alcohol dehydrogenase family)